MASLRALLGLGFGLRLCGVLAQDALGFKLEEALAEHLKIIYAMDEIIQDAPPRVSAQERQLQADTTPPSLNVLTVQAYIFHILVTVQMDETGIIYCGAVLHSGSYTPSAYELKTGTNLKGHGSVNAAANTRSNVVVNGLSASTSYDLFCYAEDASFNGISNAAILATKKPSVITASGGDYVAPVLKYVAPYFTAESQALYINVEMSEDGTVWSVALKDSGSGTTVPTSSAIMNNVGVDSWGTHPIAAQQLYKATIRLGGLQEDTVYDIYSFARDMSGNGIDNTPAYPSNVTKIAETKFAGLRTLAVWIPSKVSVAYAIGSTEYALEPATWNTHLPKCLPGVGSSHFRCGPDLESWSTPPVLTNSQLVSLASHASAGCSGHLQATPPASGTYVLLLRRGKCAFAKKALQAERAGYSGLLLVDHQTNLDRGVLPDMTAESQDATISIPAWIIGKTNGE
ncbi:unnamed protein product, partial [Polarella glacialis]